MAESREREREQATSLHERASTFHRHHKSTKCGPTSGVTSQDRFHSLAHVSPAIFDQFSSRLNPAAPALADAAVRMTLLSERIELEKVQPVSGGAVFSLA